MLKLNVSGMTCQHCVNAITAAVKQVPAVENVSVDLRRGEVVVQGAADAQAVRAAIIEEGYEVTAAAA